MCVPRHGVCGRHGILMASRHKLDRPVTNLIWCVLREAWHIKKHSFFNALNCYLTVSKTWLTLDATSVHWYETAISEDVKSFLLYQLYILFLIVLCDVIFGVDVGDLAKQSSCITTDARRNNAGPRNSVLVITGLYWNALGGVQRLSIIEDAESVTSFPVFNFSTVVISTFYSYYCKFFEVSFTSYSAAL